jgi:hypothetical protein
MDDWVRAIVLFENCELDIIDLPRPPTGLDDVVIT